MSVWSTAAAPALSLAGVEGVLVSISVRVEPPRLEKLLDALAHLDFPVNPQIYHDRGRRTLVEFPAYERRLEEIRTLLAAFGFADVPMEATTMLESIRNGAESDPAINRH